VKYLTNCEAAATSSGDGGLTVMVKISPSAAWVCCSNVTKAILFSRASTSTTGVSLLPVVAAAAAVSLPSAPALAAFFCGWAKAKIESIKRNKVFTKIFFFFFFIVRLNFFFFYFFFINNLFYW